MDKETIAKDWVAERRATLEALMSETTATLYAYQDKKNHLHDFLDSINESKDWTYEQYKEAWNACMQASRHQS